MLYDHLGAAYDQAPHVEVAKGFFKAVRGLARTRAPGLILDLGCGTGLLTELLAGAGSRVRGVDISRGMLQVARRRCRRFGARARFVTGDLLDLRTSPPAAAAFACADIVNHFTAKRDVAAFFRSARRCLAPGGVFVFDALNRWCFENYWKGQTYHFSGKSGDLVMECDWDPRRRIGTAGMTVFARGPRGYAKRTTVLRERLHDDATIRRLLLRAGFSRAEGRPWSPWTDQHEEASVDRTLWTAVR
ncbi:MAG TPA: methyltransferase domain-containing protein [Planctomycetota bacterium]|nr:methyltransferase domain-containing protein [Planctomycetota bacterium]